MKNSVAQTLALLLGVLTLGITARAQQPERVAKVNIPFEFSVGNRIFPAGRYRVVSVAPEVLELRDVEGRTLTCVLTNSVESHGTTGTPTLRFRREGDRYSLAQVFQQNTSIGQEVPPSNYLNKVAKRRSGPTQTVAANN